MISPIIKKLYHTKNDNLVVLISLYFKMAKINVFISKYILFNIIKNDQTCAFN